MPQSLSRILWLALACTSAVTAADPNAYARGDFGRFVRSLNDQSHGYAVVTDPTGTAPATRVERFEVRPGDCAANQGWNDCERDRERSELREESSQTKTGTEFWYGWWLYLPPDWPDVWPAKTVVAQFHQHESHPLWMFLHRNGELVLDDQSTGRTTRVVPLVDDANLRGRWHRFEVHAKWANDSSGRLSVWVNGQLRFDHAGPTMTARSVYLRYGVYRSFLSRATSGSRAVLPPQTALFAAVRRSLDRDGLVPR